MGGSSFAFLHVCVTHILLYVTKERILSSEIVSENDLDITEVEREGLV